MLTPQPKHLPRALAALALLAATTAGAQSIVESQVRISGFNLRLVDLDLNDGVAPSITWDTQSSYLGAALRDGATGESIPSPDDANPFHQELDTAALLGGQAVAPLALPSGNAALDLQAGAWAASASIKSSEALNEVSGGYADASAFAYIYQREGGYESALGFTLSPKTQLVVEGLAETRTTVNTQTLVSYLQAHPVSERVEGDFLVRSFSDASVNAGADLNLFLEFHEVESTTFDGMVYYGNAAGLLMGSYTALNSSYSDSTVELLDADEATLVEKQLSQPFALNIHNLSNAARPGYLDLRFSATAVATASETLNYFAIDPPVVPGVPEPGTWALMGLGLVGLSWATRRQRQG